MCYMKEKRGGNGGMKKRSETQIRIHYWLPLISRDQALSQIFAQPEGLSYKPVVRPAGSQSKFPEGTGFTGPAGKC